MHRVYALNASSTPPTKPTSLEQGYPQEGTSATIPGAWWHYMITEELIYAITALGGTPNSSLVNQLGTLLSTLKSLVETSSDLATSLQSNAVPYGTMILWPGKTPPPGFIKANGVLYPRTGTGSYPHLTDAVVSGGYLAPVAESIWSANPGAYSLGDGVSTIRVPDWRGLVAKGYHDNSGTYTTDTTSLLGRYEADQILAHTHLLRGSYDNGSVNNSATYPSGDSATQASWSYLLANAVVSTGGTENLVRNVSALWCLKAYDVYETTGA